MSLYMSYMKPNPSSWLSTSRPPLRPTQIKSVEELKLLPKGIRLIEHCPVGTSEVVFEGLQDERAYLVRYVYSNGHVGKSTCLAFFADRGLTPYTKSDGTTEWNAANWIEVKPGQTIPSPVEEKQEPPAPSNKEQR